MSESAGIQLEVGQSFSDSSKSESVEPLTELPLAVQLELGTAYYYVVLLHVVVHWHWHCQHVQRTIVVGKKWQAVYTTY